ncbi:FtsX-like permease family protein [Kytococcus sedentarius]|uniref:FtsX-like permease family protein n=1 Tax=Kytococcus sedentarius TaxID=1276 RepID=UPI0035BC5C30
MSALNDWRLALRVGAREARRSWGRSAVIVSMVSLPLVLIAASLVVTFTILTTPQEAVPSQMGQGQAYISPAHTLRGSPDGKEYGGQSLDGSDHSDTSDRTLTASAAEVAERLGGTAVARGHGMDLSLWVDGQHRQVSSVLALDLTNPVLHDIAPLKEGRYPRTPDEVVVTEVGVAEGLPTEGVLGAAVTPEGTSGGETLEPTDELRVVGVVDPAEYDYAWVVALPGTLGTPVADAQTQIVPPWGSEPPEVDGQTWAYGFVVTGDRPVRWEDIEWANARGWVVASRAEILDPSAAALAGDAQYSALHGGEFPRASIALPIAMGATALTLILLQASLMAGPAFAVGYARQRRSLALLASNGASRRQVTRYLAGQALVLGVITALIAVVAGTGLGVLAVRFADPRWPAIPFGPLEIPWLPLLGVFATAVLAVIVSAMFPALKLLRSDVATGLRTGFTTRRPARSLPLVGLVLAGASAAVVLALEPTSDEQGMVFALSLAVLVISSLLLVPWLIHAASGVARHLSAGPRLALRDLTRQRMRSVPTVGAIVGATVALVTVAMVGPAVQATFDAEYRSQAPPGGAHAMDRAPAGEEDGTSGVTQLQDAVASAAPGAHVLEVYDRVSGSPAGEAVRREAEAAGGRVAERLVLNGGACTAAAWRDNLEKGLTTQLRKGSEAIPEMGWRCEDLNGDLPSVDLTLVNREDLEHWGVHPEVREDLLAGRVATTFLWEGGSGPDHLLAVPEMSEIEASSDARLELPPVTMPEVEVASHHRDVWPASLGHAVILTERARELGLQPSEEPTWAAVSNLGSRQTTDDVAEAAPGWLLTYEEGPNTLPQRATLVLAGLLGLLMVLASVIGAALRQSESAADDASLAAVGAPTGLRRNSAVWNAVVAGGLGVVIGCLVGLVPGVALSRMVSVAIGAPRSITWPDWWLVPVLLGAIALAALAARLLVPAHPVMTVRRRP